ncbi:MAG: hypothetical protein OCD01_05590 [Fibrobacterales bacterium]
MSDNTLYNTKEALFSTLSENKSAEYFDEMYETIQSVPDDETTRPNRPLKIFSTEVEGLITIIKHNEKRLLEKNFDTKISTRLEKLIGAYRHAQSRMAWATDSYSESRKRWKALSPLAFELRNDLLNEYRFVAFGNDAVTKLIKEVSQGRTIADLIEDLHILAHPSDAIRTQLEDINFDFEQLKNAANLAFEVGTIQKDAELHRFAVTEERKIRDKVVTLLQLEEATILRWARLVFNKDKKVLRKFFSKYSRSQNNKARMENTIEEDEVLLPMDSEDEIEEEIEIEEEVA